MKEIEAKADQLLEMMTPANQDFVEWKLGRLRREKQRAEARLEDLAAVNYKPPDTEATLAAILAQLNDFPRVAAQGSVEERKEFVRAFVAGITVHPRKSKATFQMRALPVPDSAAQLGRREGQCERLSSDRPRCIKYVSVLE